MTKLNVTSLIYYVSDDPDLLVSVEDGAGQPVTGLTADNFTIGRYATRNNISWSKTQIRNVTDTGQGFYSIVHDLVSPPKPWNISSQWIFTVTVVNGADRGQALASAPYECCNDVRDLRSKGYWQRLLDWLQSWLKPR